MCNIKKPTRFRLASRGHCLFFVKGVVVQFFEIKELSKSHIKCESNFMQRGCTRIFCETSYDIVNSRLVDAGTLRHHIDGKAALFAKLPNPSHIDVRVLHFKTPCHYLYPFAG